MVKSTEYGSSDSVPLGKRKKAEEDLTNGSSKKQRTRVRCASTFYALLAALTLHIASLAVNVTVGNRKHVSRIHYLFSVCLSKFQCDRQVPCSHVSGPFAISAMEDDKRSHSALPVKFRIYARLTLQVKGTRILTQE